MKLIYCTSLELPPFGMANKIHVLEMAKSFSKELKAGFCLGGKNIKLDEFGIKSVSLGNLKSYQLAWNYLKFIKKEKFEFAYSREPFLLLFLIFFNKLFFRLKIRFIYEVHTMPENFRGKLADFLLARGADYLVFVTRYLCDQYIENYDCREKKTIIAPDGVNLEIFDIEITKEEARKKLDLPLDKKIAGYCGRFKTMGMEKGILDILKAMKFLDDGIVFVAMGGKPKHVDYYIEQAKLLGVEEKTLIFGNETQEIVALYQKAADILLMPFPDTQHYRYFMSPLKMFEYMASRRPIIASDLPSIWEVLNEKNALLVKPGDPRDLAEGIKKIFSDENLAQNLAGQAFLDARQKYTWDERVKMIIDSLALFGIQ